MLALEDGFQVYYLSSCFLLNKCWWIIQYFYIISSNSIYINIAQYTKKNMTLYILLFNHVCKKDKKNLLNNKTFLHFLSNISK